MYHVDWLLHVVNIPGTSPRSRRRIRTSSRFLVDSHHSPGIDCSVSFVYSSDLPGRAFEISRLALACSFGLQFKLLLE